MLAEEAFAAEVERASPAELLELLREEHPVYAERSTAATVRMRGWALLALGRHRTAEALLFLLEELDTATDAYLVAAAARALRSIASPTADLAPFLVRALERLRYRDEPVTFAAYGEYATGEPADTSPVRELLACLRWLGPPGRGAKPAVEALRAGGLPQSLRAEIEQTIAAFDAPAPPPADCCDLPRGMFTWSAGGRPEDTRFEDHAGTPLSYGDVFTGQPTIAVFFYTRCDNPLKCSLTIAKLARVQRLLAERALPLRTVAITYDPAYDSPARLRQYAQDRGLSLGDPHRVLRATEGFANLCRQFRLGVNFVGSLVNRHKLEAFVLNREGRIVASFERVLWDEEALVARAAEELHAPAAPPTRSAGPAPAVASALTLALLPKCPVCWAAYASAFGLAAVPHPALVAALLLVNLASLWWRARATGDWRGLALAGAGALALWWSPWWGAGLALTLAGSLWGVIGSARRAFA